MGHVFQEFHNPLISVALLCNNGCKEIFANTNVTVQRDNKTILTGYRETLTGLWRVQLDAAHLTPNHEAFGLANSIVPAGTTSDTVKFLHMACFCPSKSTLIRAVENENFATWPMFTSKNIKKHLPKLEATTMGHLDQQRKNTQSTQKTNPINYNPSENAINSNANRRSSKATTPVTEAWQEHTHNTYANLLNINRPTGQIHTNQTGQFPVQSSQGNKYVMILYDYDSNSILAGAMKSRTAHEMVRAYEKLHTYLVIPGLKPKLQRLDNEASQKLIDFMKSKQVDYQLAPPHS